MLSIIHEETTSGYTLKIVPDDDAPNPYEDFCFIGTLACWHDHQHLGNRQLNRHNGEIEKFVKELNGIKKRGGISIPVWLYDHSGMTIAAAQSNPFSCPWDSGQVGYIYITADRIRKCRNVKRITNTIKEKIKNILKAEVSMYDQFLQGDIYGYIIEDENGKELDSCWGHYGYDYAVEEGRTALKYYGDRREQAQNQ